MTDGEPLLSRSERIVRDEERLKSFRRDNPHWSVVAAELEPLMMEAANRGELSEPASVQNSKRGACRGIPRGRSRECRPCSANCRTRMRPSSFAFIRI